MTLRVLQTHLLRIRALHRGVDARHLVLPVKRLSSTNAEGLVVSPVRLLTPPRAVARTLAATAAEHAARFLLSVRRRDHHYLRFVAVLAHIVIDTGGGDGLLHHALRGAVLRGVHVTPHHALEVLDDSGDSLLVLALPCYSSEKAMYPT